MIKSVHAFLTLELWIIGIYLLLATGMRCLVILHDWFAVVWFCFSLFLFMGLGILLGHVSMGCRMKKNESGSEITYSDFPLFGRVVLGFAHLWLLGVLGLVVSSLIDDSSVIPMLDGAPAAAFAWGILCVFYRRITVGVASRQSPQ